MNDNFMPDMPEREVDAYPYPNEDVRAYFAARGRQPTPDEQIVLDECLCADSRYNLLSTRYGDVRIADPEVARAFRALLKSADRRTAFFHSVKSRCLVWKDPVPVPPRPGDLLLYIEVLPFEPKTANAHPPARVFRSAGTAGAFDRAYCGSRCVPAVLRPRQLS